VRIDILGLVKLNQSYENICFVFDHRADACRLLGLPDPEEGRNRGNYDDPRDVDFG